MAKMQTTTTAQPERDQPQALDLHGLYLDTAAAGYTHELRLYGHQVQRIVARLRGIGAISALLIAAQNDDVLNLGAWLNGGLMDAVDSLARDTIDDIEFTNDHALKAQKGGAA